MWILILTLVSHVAVLLLNQINLSHISWTDFLTEARRPLRRVTPNSEPEKPLTSTHLGEHGQFFGKVDDTGDGRSDDLGELAEGLQVHLVSVWRGGDRGLADFVWLRGDRDAGRLIRKQSQPDVDLSRGSPMRGRAEVNKCQKKRDDNNELIPSSRVLLFVWSRSHTVLLTTEPNVYQSAAENSPKQMHLT